jgi:hypothetical protein
MSVLVVAMSVDGGGGLGLMHVPVVEPGGMMQAKPLQQSLVAVHAPFSGTQLIEPHTSSPLGPGTQGSPLQQSPDEAQAPPAETQAPMPWQRGTPCVSSWQKPLLPGAEQQSLLIELTGQPPLFLKWQTSPSGMHEFMQ